MTIIVYICTSQNRNAIIIYDYIPAANRSKPTLILFKLSSKQTGFTCLLCSPRDSNWNGLFQYYVTEGLDIAHS